MAAALYLHQAVFSPDPESRQVNHTHYRTASSTTLRTITSDNSHPTEPLLHDDLETVGSAAYQDLLSRQPTHPNRPGWDMGLSFDDLSTTQRVHKGYWEKSVRRRLRLLQALKHVLEVIIGLWMVYNTVRYFIAFTIYNSQTGQTISLALGTSTAVSFGVLCCFGLLQAFQTALLARSVPLRPLILIRYIFLSVGAFFLVSPAIISFSLVFAWRNSRNPELDLSRRCRLDIDVVWPISSSPPNCHSSPSWAAWLGLSILRLILTVGVLAAHLIFTIAYNATRYPSLSKRRREIREQRSQRSLKTLRHRPSQSTSTFVPATPPSPPRDVSHKQHRSSSSTVASAKHTLKSSRSLRTTGSSHSITAHSSEDESSGSEKPFASNTPPVQSPSDAAADDRELHSFIDRFRSLVNQVSREMDEALEFARPDTGSTEDSYTSLPLRNAYYGPPSPDDDHIPMLNGFVRRMPTIESMGSRENGTASISSHELLGSRPPTRSNTLTTDTGEPLSRNSVVLVAGEFGERNRREPSDPDSVDESMKSAGSPSSIPPSLSRSTLSYHTAASGASSSNPTSPNTEYFPPVPPLSPPPAALNPSSGSRTTTYGH